MDATLIYTYKYYIIQKLGEIIGNNLATIVVPIITFVVLFLLGKGVSALLIKMLYNIAKKTKKIEYTKIIDTFVISIKGILTLTAFLIASMTFTEFVTYKVFVYWIYRVGCIIFVTRGIVSSMDGIFKIFVKLGEKANENVSDTVILFLSKIAKFLIITFSALMILSETGIDVNGIIAGLGLGGVTFALAAKDTASNIFGGFNIIIDKPFVVGDWIATSSIEGVVEDITFRSTRIRTFFDSVVVVPNNNLANENITNWAKMNKRKDSFDFGLTYSTPKETIQLVINDVKEMIIRHEDIIEDTVIVRLDGFGDSSIDIKVVYFMNKLTYADAKRIKEEISLSILDIVQRKGANFAFPTRTIFMGE